MLRDYAARYRRELLESVIPFWLRHSLDRKNGGQYTCLDWDGSVYDPRKYVWMQGRAVWMFSRLYNQFEPRQEWLEAAKEIFTFLDAYGHDEQGRYYFSLSEEGSPAFFQRKPYSAVFAVLAMIEYGKAAGIAELLPKAEALFWQIVEWVRHPELLGRPGLAGAPAYSQLADVMVIASMALELATFRPDPRYERILRDSVDAAIRHYDPSRRILVENHSPDPAFGRYPEGRLVCAGSSLEVAWFMLHVLERYPNPDQQRMVLDSIEGAMEFGWDRRHGGLYYFQDLNGKPCLQLEAPMKLWWPHTEAIYALVLAALLTGERRWLEWLERVDRYAFNHFADPEHGEWFGYCDREGRPSTTLKGGPYKGFFHVPRFLLFSVQAIEKTAESRSVSPDSAGPHRPAGSQVAQES